MLSKLYDLTAVRSVAGSGSLEIELEVYLMAFGLSPPSRRTLVLLAVVRNFSRLTGRFLFGTPSQLRSSRSV
jgi:hypothetical protein